MVYFVKKYIKKGHLLPTLTSKRETSKKLYNDLQKPYKNKERKNVKLSALSVGYIDCSKKKDQSYGLWVKEAIELMYHEMERRKEEERIKSMTDSSTYHENVKLREDVDNLIREVGKLQGISDVFIQADVKQKIWQKQWDKKMVKFWKSRGLGPYKK